mmetsp:Transcript_35144/g.60175  ORF Transcript_35144/g.60175 Transcript_35144/m.60175 type:complete len:102 (+) Transcript_35144:9-314(+)
MNFHSLLLCFGFLLLIHCGISVKQHQNSLLDRELMYDGVPSDLYVECIVALLICCYSIVMSSRPFESIYISNVYDKQTYNSTISRPEFMTFNHRGVNMYKP